MNKRICRKSQRKRKNQHGKNNAETKIIDFKLFKKAHIRYNCTMKLIEALTRFLEHAEIAKNQSPRTVENYRHYLMRFAAFVGENLDPKNIILEQVQQFRLYLNRLTDKKDRQLLQIKTQNYHMIALRAFLKYLIKNDIQTLAPEKIDLSKIPERTVE